jgi:hypothetical protein
MIEVTSVATDKKVWVNIGQIIMIEPGKTYGDQLYEGTILVLGAGSVKVKETVNEVLAMIRRGLNCGEI